MPQLPAKPKHTQAMDRFDVIQFSDLSGPGGGEWVRIGGGSFGVVFKGEYLGTDVAIKEVLPNNTYDVEKYFERECVLMKEARHPNIVQYIGLTKSPGPDGRIYIISEFVGGNLRSYIADKRKPFDWPLRLSFATDIARAVAYLHARNCMHRDLKGENLLITANDRIKVCDFGFARIAARNDDEMRRISYCGTDGYMSPEILMGVDFSLPSDVFSLGIIFCEIASRHLVDANTFKRQMPSFGVDADEVREMASKGCPTRFVDLCLDCVEVEPGRRPDMRQVLRRLREIEQEVLSREMAARGTVGPVGTLKGSSLRAVLGSKVGRDGRPKPPRLPSFDGQVQVGPREGVRGSAIDEEAGAKGAHSREASNSSDEDMEEALAALEKVGIDGDALARAAGAAAAAEDAAPPGGDAGARGEDGTPTAMPAKASTMRGLHGTSTFKIAGHGNPWWTSEDEASLPSLHMSWRRGAEGAAGGDAARHASQASDATLLPKDSTGSSVRLASGPNGGAGAVGEGEYSTSVVRPSKGRDGHAQLPSSLTGSAVLPSRHVAEHGHGGAEETASKLTTRGEVARDGGTGSVATVRAAAPAATATSGGSTVQAAAAPSISAADAAVPPAPQPQPTEAESDAAEGRGNHHGHEPSLANATIASTVFTAEATPVFHRFTLVKNGMKRPNSLGAAAAVAAFGSTAAVAAAAAATPSSSSAAAGGANNGAGSVGKAAGGGAGVAPTSSTASFLPPGVIFANALSKCSVCGKRLGFGAFMDCDDCPYKTHAGCAQYAEANCREMQIPSTPVLSTVNVARRGSGDSSLTMPDAAARAGSPASAPNGTPSAAAVARTGSPRLGSGPGGAAAAAAAALVRAVTGGGGHASQSNGGENNHAAATTTASSPRSTSPPPGGAADSAAKSKWRLTKRSSKSPPPRGDAAATAASAK